MNRRTPVITLAVLLLVAAGLALIAVGRGCRAEPPPPATIAPTVTATSTPVRISPTSPPGATISPSVTFAPPTATVAPELPTMTPAARISPTPTAAPTVALLGRHVVRRGETMYGIALAWEPGRWFLWGRDVWEPVCAANPQIVDCRVIYPGDVLGIPRR